MKTLRMFGAAAAFAALAFASATTLPVVLSTPAAAQAAQDDNIATSNGNLTIHPVHHAAVVLTWSGKRIVVDPTPFPPDPMKSGAADFKGANPPDLILITHEHPDHYNVPTLNDLVGPNTLLVVPQDVANMLPNALKAKARVMKNGDKMTIAGIPIEAVPAYNTTPDRLMYHPKGRDNGYVLTLGGKRVYFAGDTEETPELKQLKNIDVAFIPMNLPYTMTEDAAAAWTKDFKPKIVYPYHYGMSDVNKYKAAVGNASDVRLRKWY